MSMQAAVLTRNALKADDSREQSPWTVFLALGVIAACGIGLSLFLNVPVVEASLVLL